MLNSTWKLHWHLPLSFCSCMLSTHFDSAHVLMIPHFVSNLIVQQKYLSSLCRHYVRRGYQRIWGKFQFLLSGTRRHWTSCHLGQVGIGQVGLGHVDLGPTIKTPNMQVIRLILFALTLSLVFRASKWLFKLLSNPKKKLNYYIFCTTCCCYVALWTV